MEKLVRDKIPQLMRDQGKNPEVRQVTGLELEGYLKTKVEEEVKEMREAPTDMLCLKEVADLEEALTAFRKVLCGRMGITSLQYEQLKFDKANEKGVFDQGYVVQFES